MTTATKKVLTTLIKKTGKISSHPTFFKLATKNLGKKKNLINKNLSKHINKIVYGV